MVTRRNFITAGAALTGASLLPAWARSATSNDMRGITPLSGSTFDLSVDRRNVMIDGKGGKAICVNGHLPAPLLRWREGDDITLRVRNMLDEDTSIHWHGILLPFQMDGVPGVSFLGIKPGETFTYKFPVKQAGTYWYHSHSGMQEQAGHYGPIIIDPKGADPASYDRDYVIVLSDWTFKKPERLFARLKKSSEASNFQKRTLADFIRDAGARGFGDAFEERAMWGAMRMSPTDIADVTGADYTYLINGHGPEDNWTALFNPRERVRLRIINASAMSIFNCRIPGLPMTVVQADGLDVQPVETDEFQIGVAETYDAIIQPTEHKAFTLMAESVDRSGYARATLTPELGLTASVPPLRERPTLTMRDMGMDHGDMDHSDMASGMNDGKDHSGMDHGAMNRDGSAVEHNHADGPGVVNKAAAPSYRLSEPGIGLENAGHRVLTYADLKSLAPIPDTRPPEREIELHLTSNMERYMWSFDGVKFSDAKEPINLAHNERVRLTMINDTMMAHPIHLHGMFFEVVVDPDAHHGGLGARKHTIIVKPGEKLSVDVTADAMGDWAFHCHLLYHMMAGMMRVVSISHGAMNDASDDSEMDHSGHKGMDH